MRPGVLPMTRATKQQSSEWVDETSPRPKKLKFQRSRNKTRLIIFFRPSRRIAQSIRTRGKTVNAEFYKEVMDHLLKCIPAAFCSQDFFLLRRPPTKLQVFANF
jgi:hypothetical protein